jgi:hypothetical protein
LLLLLLLLLLLSLVAYTAAGCPQPLLTIGLQG